MRIIKDENNFFEIKSKIINEVLIMNIWYYEKDDLGINYTKEMTVFRVWAPTADNIKVLIYKNESDDKNEYERIANFKRDENGSWEAIIKEDLAGKYFLYLLFRNNRKYYLIDPYTRGVGTNSQKGLIVSLAETNPPGWEKDKRIKLNNPLDAIIYETHIRDFTSSYDSGIINKNKYLAFTEKGSMNYKGLSTGIDHLKEFGISHLHLQPVFDFATVDDKNLDDYNWGYDPLYYNVPEGSYATNPSNYSRIIEFKKMIMSLHNEGIGFIMDVVYNHTYNKENSSFDILAPDYYYRLYDSGFCSNGSGCGNEIASEKSMVQKFIIDSLQFWLREYHVDGFRFDLMALIDKETMKKIEKRIHNIDDSILLYGEPWCGGQSLLPFEKKMIKGKQQGLNIAVFNDNFRNAIKGDNDGDIKGFVNGAHYLTTAIKRGVVGGIDFAEEIRDFCYSPHETINYVSSHDNLTLWDKLSRSNGDMDEKQRIKMDRLAQTIIMTSQGISFIYGGEEFLRTKYGHHNTYKAGDDINRLKWGRKSKYINTFRYYQGLISLRKKFKLFHLRTAEKIKECLSFIDTPENTVGFMLNDQKEEKNISLLILYNPNLEEIDFSLPFSGIWNVLVNGNKAGIKSLGIIKGDKVKLADLSAMVLVNS